MNIRLLILSLLAAGVALAQQPQTGVTAPSPQQQKTEQQQRDEAVQRQHRAQQNQQNQQQQQRAAEASPDELKVSEEDAKKQVTDANKASELIGMKVVNRQNEDLGKIKDIVVDFETGKVAYVVLSSGTSFFGQGGRNIAVPVSALTLREGEEGFLIDAEKSRLEQAQGFSEDNWPAIDAAQQSTVGLQPDPEKQNRQQERNRDRNNAVDNNNPDRARAKDTSRPENR